MSALEDALALRPSGDGHWLAFSDPRYDAPNGMFGGWTAAVVLRGAISSASGAVKPSALTIGYLRKIEPGIDLLVQVDRVGASRSTQHWRADVRSAETHELLAQAMLVFAERRSTDGHTEPSMPAAPDPETLDIFHPPFPAGQQVQTRLISGFPPTGRDTTASTHWVRDESGRPVDEVQLAFLVDIHPPRSWFWSADTRPSATLTLSVYFLATDQEIEVIGDDYVLLEAIATRGADSIFGDQVRVWSRSGALLATSEQLCRYR